MRELTEVSEFLGYETATKKWDH